MRTPTDPSCAINPPMDHPASSAASTPKRLKKSSASRRQRASDIQEYDRKPKATSGRLSKQQLRLDGASIAVGKDRKSKDGICCCSNAFVQSGEYIALS